MYTTVTSTKWLTIIIHKYENEAEREGLRLNALPWEACGPQIMLINLNKLMCFNETSGFGSDGSIIKTVKKVSQGLNRQPDKVGNCTDLGLFGLSGVPGFMTFVCWKQRGTLKRESTVFKFYIFSTLVFFKLWLWLFPDLNNVVIIVSLAFLRLEKYFTFANQWFCPANIHRSLFWFEKASVLFWRAVMNNTFCHSIWRSFWMSFKFSTKFESLMWIIGLLCNHVALSCI